MKIAILFILFLLFSQVLETQLLDAINPNGEHIKYLSVNSTPYTGKVYNYFDNNARELVGHYEKGLKTDQWIWWHPNGIINKSGFFKNSKEDSLWQWWHVNGNLKMRGNYKNSIKQGRWNEWNDEGVLISSSSYLNGTLNGKCVSRYSNGKKSSEI